MFFLSQILLNFYQILFSHLNFSGFHFTFTFMHLSDAFIQSDLQYIQVIHFWSVFFVSILTI